MHDEPFDFLPAETEETDRSLAEETATRPAFKVLTVIAIATACAMAASNGHSNLEHWEEYRELRLAGYALIPLAMCALLIAIVSLIPRFRNSKSRYQVALFAAVLSMMSSCGSRLDTVSGSTTDPADDFDFGFDDDNDWLPPGSPFP